MANIILATAAVFVAGAAVSRELRLRAPSGHGDVEEQRAVYVDQWMDMLADGMELGPTGAPVRIIEFADLECPFCARWHLTGFKQIRAEYGARVALTVMHLPIPRNRFAVQAAVAAECTLAQGRLREFLDVVYANQDSIGLKPWRVYAEEAGVGDSERFAQCVSDPVPARIAAGQRWARRLGVQSTPTFIVNGWRLARPPTNDELSKLIGTLVAGQAPF